MKKCIWLLMSLVVSSSLLAAMVNLNDKSGRLYLTGSIGAGLPFNSGSSGGGIPQSMQTGMALNASIGYYVYSHFHIEVGGGYNHFGIRPFDVYSSALKTKLQVTGTENLWSIHTNFLYDVPMGDSLTFTFGGGLGWALNTPNAYADDGVIAYKYNLPESNHGMVQGIAALNYMLGNDYAVGLNYSLAYLPNNYPIKYINQFAIGFTSYF